jgi:hypothetical protein
MGEDDHINIYYWQVRRKSEMNLGGGAWRSRYVDILLGKITGKSHETALSNLFNGFLDDKPARCKRPQFSIGWTYSSSLSQNPEVAALSILYQLQVGKVELRCLDREIP